MSNLLAAAPTIVSLPTSALPPLAVGFMGLGTGYLIYGPHELFGYPKKERSVNEAMGAWGIWLPGFLQFFTGFWLFAGLAIFGNYAGPAYMAGLAFTAYGVHWFVIGWNKARGNDPRASMGMTIGFFLISVLGMIVFFDASDFPVGGLFIGLTLIYVADFFASLKADLPDGIGSLGERALGFFHLGTGLWLMYLMFAAAINFSIKGTLPL